MNLRIYLTVLFTCSFIGVFFGQSTPIIDKETTYAEMTFEEVTFEYGKILQGEKIKNVFEFSNTGSEPLLITAAKGSCGCTVPEWPTHPIMPGETGQILVVFDSKGKKGKQSKRVTLTANTNPANNFLTIKGEVLLENEVAEIAAQTSPAIRNEKVDVANFSIFPNPTKDQLNITLNEMEGATADVQIYNQTGELMTARKVDKVTNENISFDISNYPSGKYAVTIKVDGKTRVAKLIAKL